MQLKAADHRRPDFPRRVRRRASPQTAHMVVAEVAFPEWARASELRQATFQGMRYDRDAKEVRREGSSLRQCALREWPFRQRFYNWCTREEDYADPLCFCLPYADSAFCSRWPKSRVRRLTEQNAVAQWDGPFKRRRCGQTPSQASRSRWRSCLREALDYGGRRATTFIDSALASAQRLSHDLKTA
ncbi:hypothetical protein OKW41_005116 [Paraburkholderia sp. UCT70]